MAIDPLDIPFESFQKRLRAGELRTPDLDDRNRRAFGLSPQVVVRDAYAADRESIPDSFQGGFSYTPTWHFHGHSRKG
jgi:hypothetical protein